MTRAETIERAAAQVAASKRAVALTGAGISTESGVPDFRSPTGVWSRYDPDEFSYQRFVSSSGSRRNYWRWGMEFYPLLKEAQPNAAHLALAELERRQKLRCVITQNIDGLHQRAGSKEIIELHGTAMSVSCLGCGKEWPREEVHRWMVEDGIEDPECDACGGLLKPKTISFGQAMPEAETRRAFAEAAGCDLFLAVGSSLVVFPAAALVPTACETGAGLILINLEPTGFDHLADVAISGKAGEILPEIVAALPA
jgi:NAD-dependent deacetylase